ncbi:uncharacterized protein LOC144443680 [Glandiceps talaboti]
MAEHRRSFGGGERSSFDDMNKFGNVNGGADNSRNFDSRGNTFNHHKSGFTMPDSRGRSERRVWDRDMQNNDNVSSTGNVTNTVFQGELLSQRHQTQFPREFPGQQQNQLSVFQEAHREHQSGYKQQQHQHLLHPQQLLLQQIHQLRDEQSAAKASQSATQASSNAKQQHQTQQPSSLPFDQGHVPMQRQPFDQDKFPKQPQSLRHPLFEQEKILEQQHSHQQFLPPPFDHEHFKQQHLLQQPPPTQFEQDQYSKQQHPVQQHPMKQSLTHHQLDHKLFPKQQHSLQQPLHSPFDQEQFAKQQHFVIHESQPPIQQQYTFTGNTTSGRQETRNMQQSARRDEFQGMPPKFPQRQGDISVSHTQSTSVDSTWQSMRSDVHQSTLFGHSDSTKQSLQLRPNSQQSVAQNQFALNIQEKEESEDQEWIDNWCRRKHGRDTRKKSQIKPKHTIGEFKQLLKETIELNDQLLEQRDVLVKQVDKDESTWQFEIRKANKIKEKLLKAQVQLHDAEQISLMRQKLDKVKKKRESGRRRKKRQQDDQEEILSRREELHRKFDEELAKDEEKKLDKKREKVLQKEIDETFFDIRQKKSEANKVLNVMKLLRKLRQVRKESAGKRGYIPAPQSTRVFEVAVDKLEEMMKKQRDIYADEEKTMQVMMDFKQEENKEKERELQRRHLQEKAKKIVKEQLECLFGKEENLGPNDPILPYRQYYLQAENSFQSLLDIRHQWDTFLVQDGTPGESSIPLEWVVPPEPSSEVWAACLEKT